MRERRAPATALADKLKSRKPSTGFAPSSIWPRAGRHAAASGDRAVPDRKRSSAPRSRISGCRPSGHAPPHPQFAHIFASDAYSAGYYSYLWRGAGSRRVRAFMEARPIRQSVAKRLRDEIMCLGNSVDRRRPTGIFAQDPSIDALLRPDFLWRMIYAGLETTQRQHRYSVTAATAVVVSHAGMYCELAPACTCPWTRAGRSAVLRSGIHAGRAPREAAVAAQ